MHGWRLTRQKLERFTRDLQLGGEFFAAAERSQFLVSDLGDPLILPTGRVWQTPFGDLIEQSRRYRLTTD